MSQEAPISVSEHSVATGQVVAQAELSVPTTLNSLSLEMTRLLDTALTAWAEREDVVVQFGKAVEDKSSCFQTRQKPSFVAYSLKRGCL